MAKAIAGAGRRLYIRGFMAGLEGNISARLDDGTIMVTPSGLPKGDLRDDDMVVVDARGKHLEGQHAASSELPMHLLVYRRRPDVKACIHSHAPYSTSFAVAGMGLADDILPEGAMAVGPVPLAEYAPPGTTSVPRSLEPFIDLHEAFLLSNHGLLTIGGSLRQALLLHETVEHCARIVHLARQLGNVNRIPKEDCERLRRIRRDMATDRFSKG
ncbi:MAG: class II aldolase/adducin family protein [Candidatus Zixiibacteriota bacterium]|nr:MAG: class II aldolase/adducin family protein [candidate division Zixibacteria bacterium]